MLRKATLLICLGLVPFASVYSYDANKGEEVYKTSCFACHGSGVLNAPKLGDAADWAPRIPKGLDALVSNAIKGINQMPPKGGRADLPDNDIRDAVEYLVEAAKRGEVPANSSELNPAAQAAKAESFVPVLKLGEQYSFPTDESGYFLSPKIEDAPKDKFGDEVRLGYKIFMETTKYAPRYAIHALTCNNCHLDGGRKPHAVPMWGAAGIYPIYRNASDRSDNMADRIQACFRASMNGFAPAHDAPEMRALLSYIQYISRGVPIGVSLPGRSMPDDGKFSLPEAGFEPSPTRGKVVFENRCSVCHGADGHGKKRTDGTYEFPPLWGFSSYNKSASLYKNDYLARFIWANMPFGQGFSLTPQEAWDVATFINIHERPKHPKKGIWSEIFGK